LQDSPPRKIAKVAIPANADSAGEETETTIEVKCFTCNYSAAGTDQAAKAIADFIRHVSSSAVKSQTKAWEAEVIACEHTLCLEQLPNIADGLDKCRECGLKNNLWLCMTCGNIGCGRKNYDGSGGNNHGIQHYQSTFHPVSCKLGTITAEGTAGRQFTS
jgi:ubiquitin carboxyl-terminal hydrolase 5/13